MATSAGALRIRSRMQSAAEPNVIPFIDVLLVLLIIFMVTAPKPTTDIRLDLTPRGSGAAQILAPTIVQLRAEPSGYRLFVNNEETTLAQVSEVTLSRIMAADGAITHDDALAEARVYVRADLDVAYQNVVAVVDDLQQAHFQKVAIIPQDANG